MNEMDEKVKKVEKRMRTSRIFANIALICVFIPLLLAIIIPDKIFEAIPFFWLIAPSCCFLAIGAAIITITENDIKNGRI